MTKRTRTDKAVNPRRTPAAAALLALLLAATWLAPWASAETIPGNFLAPAWLRQSLVNFSNPGSCVQCSISGAGHNTAHRGAQTLLWHSEYGSPVLGGSGPSRVRRYAVERDIPCWNITGKDTYKWLCWAAKTHRVAGLGFGANHFQLMVGIDGGKWLVLDNNPPGPRSVARYSDRSFRKNHAASGHWVVIIARPPPPACPNYLNQWWMK